MCLYPRLINNPKYKKTKKNGGVIPPILDKRVTKVPIGCGKCIECKKQKASEWRARLTEDIKTNKNGKFITLTFSNESIAKINKESIYENKDSKHDKKEIKIAELSGYDKDNAIATWAVRHFLERWRKQYAKSLRHWLITELGHNGTENIHLHGIIWTNENLDTVEKIWQYGFMWKGKKNKSGTLENFVNERTINYITKYVNKADEKHKLYNSKILCSKGIGANYINSKLGDWTKNTFKDTETNEAYRTRTGNKISLPIYWRNKIYTEEQREKLWLQKLDKQERWVLGERIDISKSESEYYTALTYARRINDKLGYGNTNVTWEQEQYERDRRILMQEKRMNTIRTKYQRDCR